MPICTLCELSRNAKSNCIRCEGKPECGLMLVGEAPGAREDSLNRPFVGDAGIVLSRILKSLDIKRGEIAINNAVRCRPPDNRDPRPEEIEMCRDYLVRDIQELKPSVVVPMGNIALQSLLRRTSIANARGNVYTSEEFPGVLFFPTTHPAVVLRRPAEEVVIRHDIKRALKICQTNCKVERIPTTYKVCHTLEESLNLLRQLAETTPSGSYITYDTETTGLDYRKDQMLCISFSNKIGTGWVIPILGRKLRNIWTEEEHFKLIRALTEWFENPAIPKCTQNGAFDELMLFSNFGIKVRGEVIDTMLLHHAVDENMFHNLDFLSTWYTDVAPYKKAVWNTIPKGAPRNLSEASEDALWNYAAQDADVTFRVAGELEKEAAAEGVRIVHDRIMLPLSKVLSKAEWDGILIDQEELTRQQDLLSDARKGLLSECWALAGKEFNPNSSKQVGHILFDDFKLPVIKMTKPSKTFPNGNRSTDKEVLAALASKHPIVPKLLKISHLAHDISNYLKGKDGKTGGMLKFIADDNRVHPQWRITGAVTGRLSAAAPAIHNIKRPNEDSIGDFRKLFVPTPGWMWIGSDYAQMEARVVARVAPDEKLASLFHQGVDIHRMVASQIFNVPYDDVTMTQRAQAKGVVFGLNYGRMEWSLAQGLGISIKAARKYIDSYFQMCPGVARHFKNVQHLLNTEGVITTPFGRKRRFHGAVALREAFIKGVFSGAIKKDTERFLNESFRQAINFTVQSPANDILSLACIRIHKRFSELRMQSRLLISHHDAWHGEAPENELEDAASIVKEEMERPVPELGGASFPVDIGVGLYWGDNSIKIKGVTTNSA